MYKVHIEPDETTSKKKPAYKVAIRSADNTMVGVPARGVTRDEALALQQVVQRAFQYGLQAGRRQMEAHLWNTYELEALSVTPEEGPYVQVVG